MELVKEVLKSWPGDWEKIINNNNFHEATNLHLQNEKAYKLLGWKPKWNFEKTVYETISWYKKVKKGEDAYQSCKENIEDYFSI